METANKSQQNMIAAIEQGMRRLPVYLLLDCSQSMVGEGIVAVQQGMMRLVQELKQDPHAIETVWLSVITFSSAAKQEIPLTDITIFQPPALRIRPGTKLGAALQLLQDCIRREVRSHTPTRKGDYRPLVFLLTDGEPTDAWERQAQSLRTFYSGKPLNTIAIGCGPDVNTGVLLQITDNVIALKNYSSGDFQKLFKWISASVTTASKMLDGKNEGGVNLPALPKELLEQVSKGQSAKKPGALQKEFFLALRCSRTREGYLVRYALDAAVGAYNPVRTHKVERDYFNERVAKEDAAMVSTNLLRGILPCPYCENENIGTCPTETCGAMFCSSPKSDSLQCPGCQTDLKRSGDPVAERKIGGTAG